MSGVLRELLKAVGDQRNGYGDVLKSWPDGADMRGNLPMTPDQEEAVSNYITPKHAPHMHISPQNPSDPNVIYDDAGQAVDYDTKDPISNALKGIFSKNKSSAEQGTVRHFMSRFLKQEPDKTMPAILEGGIAGRNELSNVPTRNNPEISKPRVNYSMPGLDPKGLEELRADLWKKSGQAALPLSTNAPVVETDDPNGLRARMNSPNSKAEQSLQMRDAETISNIFRRRG